MIFYKKVVLFSLCSRKRDPVLPHVVLVSGHADMKRDEAIKKGAIDLFLKPLDMEKVITLIKKTIVSS